MKRAVFTFSLLLLSYFVFANNIQLQKVSLTDTNRAAKTVNIKMNISWEHSWRDSINWDAAWIIIKYKEPKDSLWKWKHAQLVQSGNNTGTATGVKIVVPDDLVGAFFYRSVIGSGNIASDNVKLVWNYGTAGVANIDSVEVRVFATEMVYVPQGNYCLGDGNGITRSENSFQLKNNSNNYTIISDKWSPLINTDNNSYYSPIYDDANIYKNGFRVSGSNGLDLNDDKSSDYPNYPTGYKAFYCMKYKVTQGQYADFLNTLYANDTTQYELESYVYNSTDPYHRERLHSVPNELRAVWSRLGDNMAFTLPVNYNRNSIVFDSLQFKFIVSRPDRAYSGMNLFKSASFSEWLGLRPMSELEYEKACRGPLPPLTGEFAWGDDRNIPGYSGSDLLTFNGVENGTEFFKDYDITKRNVDFLNSGTKNGDGGVGPIRVGIFATDTSSRISANSSYFGIMDLSKINSEIVVPISDGSFRNLNLFINGNSKLTAFGSNYSFSNVIGFNLNTINGYYGLYKYASVSTRNPSSSADHGFRAVRSAPSDN